MKISRALGMDQKDGENLASHNLQRTQGCALRVSRLARGSSGSPEKGQASARVDVPTAPSNRHRTASLATWPCSRLGAQEFVPNLVKDVDEHTIFDLDEEEEQEEEEEQPSEQNRPPAGDAC